MFNESNRVFNENIKMLGDDRDDLDAMYPFILKSGEGALVYDLDGNEYIDFTNANGAIVLGYSYKEVDDAVVNQIRAVGNVLTTQYNTLKVELTKKLISLFPNYDRAAYFKTGSDATDAAIRIARVASKKDIILTCGYHGWHDWQLNMFPRFRFEDERHINFRYDLDFLEDYLSKHADKVAGVIVTPDLNYFDADYFLKLEAIVRKHKVIYILDEVASGFRFEIGGLQKMMGLDPDITCLGKGLANGYSISAVLGKHDIMYEACLETHMWSTYNSEMIGFAASLKTIEIMERENIYDQINYLSRKFADGLESLFSKFAICGEVISKPNIFHIVFEDEDLLNKFVEACYLRGILLSKDFENMLNFSHTEDHINKALSVIEESFVSLVDNGDLKRSKRIPLSREAINCRLIEEFDANIDFTIFNSRE